MPDASRVWLLFDFLLIVLSGMWLLVLVYASQTTDINLLAPFRLVLGLVFVLFVPGYALQATLFPRGDDLDNIERIGLSVGLSIAIVPVLALILDRLPWGLRLWPIVIAQVLVSLLFALTSILRRLRYSSQERFIPLIGITEGGWRRNQDKTNRRIYLLLAGVLTIALLAGTVTELIPKAEERFTEFYILGPQGIAENFPREVTAGQPVSVNLGIHNQEGEAEVYRVEVIDSQGVIGSLGPFRLSAGEKIETPLSFTPKQTGNDVQVTIHLFREGLNDPYRTLQLWMIVNPTP